MPIRIPATFPSTPRARSRSSISGSWAGSTAQTRYYLADMLVGFLTGDYRRVAEVHFTAGYVPKRRSLDAFTQACRSIGEPILGRPLHEISIARLLAQLFQVTEQFEMETQPQLLLLQKTMVLIEGVGRRLDPTVNIWEPGAAARRSNGCATTAVPRRACKERIDTIARNHRPRCRACCATSTG